MKVLVVHIWLLLLLLCLSNRNLASASAGNSEASSPWTTPRSPTSQTSAPSSQSTTSPTPSSIINSPSGQCSVPTVLCCPGLNSACNRGCYCDEACKTLGDCCPDYNQTCNHSNSQPSIPSLPSPSMLPSSPTSPDSPIFEPYSPSSSSQTSAPSSSSPSSTPPTSASAGNSEASSPWTTPRSPTSQTSAPSSQSTTSPTPSSIINSPSGQCSVPTVLCCPGLNSACNRGCYCDEACKTLGDCCPDYNQTCNHSNSQPSIPSLPSPSMLPSSPTSPDSPIFEPYSPSSSSQTSAPSSSSPSPTPPTSASAGNSEASSPRTTPRSPTSQTSAPSSSSQSTTSPTPSSIINSPSGQCSVPTVLCCPGHNNGCYRGCYCDEACIIVGDCCSDYNQTCYQSNSHLSTPPSSPPSSTWTTPHSPTLSSSQVPDYFLPFGDGDVVNPISDDGSSEAIFLQQPFIYFGHIYNQIYVNNNGHLTFTGQLSAYVPYLNSGIDIIAPLWTDLNNVNGGTISYREDTSSAVLAQVTEAVNQYFPDVPFSASSAFVATWDRVPYFNHGGMATFQVVLASSGEISFILINYGDITETGHVWLAGFDSVDSSNSFTISLPSASELSSNSNVNYNGRWVFHVDGVQDVCNHCTENEACQVRGGVYGCGCLDGQRPNPEIFDAVESCASSTGSISLSRCQLFESGFYPYTLHLNDPSCKGSLENGRLLFHFDNEGHVCGTTLMSNITHFIYQNSIQSNPKNTEQSIISRDMWMNVTFSCAYPLIQTLSMPMGFRAEAGVISNELPAGQGTYQIRMIPYHDAHFTSPYEEEQVQVNQQMYVAVEVEGVDGNQIATVLDNCWATPVNDAEYHIRWNLIIKECPNPDDPTVEVLQNGNDTRSHFSFRMFTFTGISDHVFLHCQVHLCLVQNGRCALLCNHGYRSRRHRSLDFLHSAGISMSLKAQ